MPARDPSPGRFVGAFLAHTVLLPLYAVLCVLAPFFLPQRVSMLLATALEAAGGTSGASHAPRTAGAMACGFVLVLLGASGVGHMAVPAIAHDGGSAVATALLTLLAPTLVGAVLAPFVLAPLALLDGEEGVVPSIVRAFELAARRGARRTTGDGALLGAGVGLAWLVVVGTDDELSVVRAVLGFVVATGAGAPLAAMLLARAYVDARSRPAFTGADARVTRSVRTVALLVVPATVALALAMLAAVVTPAPMSRAPLRDERAEWGPALPVERGVVAIPGVHGLVVRPIVDGVAIETADGGGAGVVTLPRGAWLPDDGELFVHRCPGGFAIVRGGYVTYVDDEGVRLDDGLGDRLSRRVGRQTLALLLVAIVLGAWWERRLRGVLAAAAALDAPELRRDAAPPDASPEDTARLTRIAGRIRLDDGATIIAHRDTARVEGMGRFVSSDGETVLALPSEILLVVPLSAGSDITDGRTVSLLVRGDALARLGLRQGATPWPEGARLLATDRDDAAEALLARTARASSLVALGIAAALVTVAWSIVTAL